jgi:hypothetical protein
MPARLSDMAHGWLDGRKGLPQLAEDARPPGQEVAIPSAEADPASLVRTPRMAALARQARELIEGEEQRLHDEEAALTREWFRFLAARDALSNQMAAREEKLKEARSPLSAGELEHRRLAELDVADRPDGLVRGRRQAGWEHRLARAEQDYDSATVRLAEATREAQLRDELIRHRIAVAQATARRHRELALRRIATYQQQLVRTHRRGAELNRLLLDYPVGLDLPEWTRRADPPRSPTSDMDENP